MDELKTSVQNAVYEQKDPLLIYKLEAFELFKKMISEVNRDVISFLFKGNLPDQQGQPQQVSQARQQRTDMSRMKTGQGKCGMRLLIPKEITREVAATDRETGTGNLNNKDMKNYNRLG